METSPPDFTLFQNDIDEKLLDFDGITDFFNLENFNEMKNQILL